MAVISLLLLTGSFYYALLRGGGVWPDEWYPALAVIAAAALLRFATAREAAPSLPPAIRYLLVILLGAGCVQLIPLPAPMLAVLSPVRAELDRAVADIGGTAPFGTLSANPAATFEKLTTLLACVVVFLLVRSLAWRFRDRVWVVAAPLVAAGLLEAALGLMQASAGIESVSGTYANRNHFAGLLEMALPFPIVYGSAVYGRGRDRYHTPLKPALYTCVLLGIGAVMLMGILGSLSRMGFLAALTGLFVAGALSFGGTLDGARRWIPVSGVAALMLAGFVFLPSDQLIARFGAMASTEEISGDTRTQIWQQSSALPAAYPVFGCGLGSYESCFYRYKNVAPMNTVDFAHNDYLQLQAELGLAGFVPLMLLAALTMIRAAKGALERSSDEGRYLALACAAALAAIAAHSLVDFNLYVPANAVAVAWIGGMAHARWES